MVRRCCPAHSFPSPELDARMNAALMYDKLRLRKYCRYIVFKIDKVDGVETIVIEREAGGGCLS